jgi:hypothetical protein
MEFGDAYTYTPGLNCESQYFRELPETITDTLPTILKRARVEAWGWILITFEQRNLKPMTAGMGIFSARVGSTLATTKPQYVLICARMSTGTGDDWVQLEQTLRGVCQWLRYLPSWSCPYTLNIRGSGVVRYTGEAFRPDVVRRVKKLLAPLVVTAVDKQVSALLLQ